MISEKFAAATERLQDYSLFVFNSYLRLLILSAIDSYNLIYSLACVNMSKISFKVKVKSEK